MLTGADLLTRLEGQSVGIVLPAVDAYKRLTHGRARIMSAFSMR